MSVTLFRLFISPFRQRLPRYSKSDLGKSRFATVMDATAKEKTVDNESELVSGKNGTRYKKRYMKRQWEEISPKKEDGETNEKKLCEKPDRIKRKKVALLLGYCGVDYYGMQRNPGVRTIEEDLLKALWGAKYVTEDDFNNQQNTQFQRSSRTDKGVSAARQVVSLKLPLELDIAEINKRLPDCIRVFGIKRVTNKFNSKIKCNARTYSYTIPTFAFEPSLLADEQRKQYRITEEKLEQIRNILEVYKGTKGYHNFTEKKHYQDPSASRYMMSFNVEKVFIESDMEFAVLLVKGQSFMLHQIRKMVGLTLAIVRGHTDKCILDKAFGKDKVMIPTAPGLGLVLDMVHYDRYDTKFKDSHGSLTWDTEEETVQQFKHQHIYPNIVKGEVEGNSMGTWLEKLGTHSYEPSEDASGGKGTDNDEIAADDNDDDDDADSSAEIQEKYQEMTSAENKDVSSADNQVVVVGSNVDTEEESQVKRDKLLTDKAENTSEESANKRIINITAESQDIIDDMTVTTNKEITVHESNSVKI